VPVKFEMVEGGAVTVNAIYLEIDSQTGRAKKIERVDNEVMV
jgi:calcineurin-like phosphoesterase